MDFAKLQEPFDFFDIEWRVQQSGSGARGIWARVIPYVKNRAIMARLDAVCGPDGWRNEYAAGPVGGLLCGLSIKCGSEWVTKWDGAANTEVKDGGKLDDDTNIKGGFSASMKRAAVQWGIGRYLYLLEAGYAQIVKADGRYYSKLKIGDKYESIYWNPPELPAWALPKKKEPAPKATPLAGNTPAAPAQNPVQGNSQAPAAASAPSQASSTPPAPSGPVKDPPAPPPQHKPNAADELVSVLAACFEGTTAPVFDEKYKETLRQEILTSKEKFGPKVAYEYALNKAKVELADRVAKAKAASQPAQNQQPDIF
jgi:hypothetical protein